MIESAAWFGVAVSTKAPLFLIRLPLQRNPPTGYTCRVERCFHAVPGRVYSTLAWLARCALPIVTATTSSFSAPKHTLFGISLWCDRGSHSIYINLLRRPGMVKSDPQLVTRLERTSSGISPRHVLVPIPIAPLLVQLLPGLCPVSYSSQQSQPHPRLSPRFDIIPPVKCDRQARLSDMMPPTRWQIQRLSCLDINDHRVRRIWQRSGSFGV